MKKLIFLILLFSWNSVFACTVPRSGPEYDSLIEIVGPDKKGIYTVSVPIKIEGLEKSARVLLAYTEVHDDGFFLMEKSEKVKLRSKDGKLIGKFSTNKSGHLKPYIWVEWPPDYCCLCGAVAVSGLLK